MVIKSRRIIWALDVGRTGDMRNAYIDLVWKPEEKRPLGRPKRRWEDNIRMDMRKMVCDGVEWMNLSRDRDHWRDFVNTLKILRVSIKSVDYEPHEEDFAPWS